MKSEVNTHISIAEQIIEGSISIKSIEEFKSVLKIFPSDAALQKAYSDLLMKQKRPNEAARSYDKSARLFIDSGKILQAIDSKLLQWKIKSPSPKEAEGEVAVRKDDSENRRPGKRSFFYCLRQPERNGFCTFKKQR
jgi:predicted Zn-dependent protease